MDLLLWGDITEETTRPIFEALLQPVEPTNLYICSQGGELQPALALFDHILKMGKTTTINTIGCGQVYSAAAIIFCAGYNRLSYRNTSFMFHEISYELPDAYHGEQKRFTEFTETTQNSMYENVLENLRMNKKDKDVFLQEYKNTLWLTPEEAQEYGIVTELI